MGLGYWEIGNWNLFGNWDLVIGILERYLSD
jgi:hypothetical protein